MDLTFNAVFDRAIMYGYTKLKNAEGKEYEN